MNKISEDFLLPEYVSLVPIDSNVCRAENSGSSSGPGNGGTSGPEEDEEYDDVDII